MSIKNCKTVYVRKRNKEKAIKRAFVRTSYFNCKTTNFLLRQILSAKKLHTLNKHQLKNILFEKFSFSPFLLLSFVQDNSSSAKNTDCDSLNKGTTILTNENFNSVSIYFQDDKIKLFSVKIH